MVQCADKVLESIWSSKSLAGHRRVGGLAWLCGSRPAMSLQLGFIVDAVSSSPAQQNRTCTRRTSLNWKWHEPSTRCPARLELPPVNRQRGSGSDGEFLKHPVAKLRIFACFACQIGRRQGLSPARLFPLIKWSTPVLASPVAHGADNRAKVAPLGGKHVLGPRRTHRIETPPHDAILLERPEPLRQRRRRNAI
jgi:hypothetical protein